MEGNSIHIFDPNKVLVFAFGMNLGVCLFSLFETDLLFFKLSFWKFSSGKRLCERNVNQKTFACLALCNLFLLTVYSLKLKKYVLIS